MGADEGLRVGVDELNADTLVGTNVGTQVGSTVAGTGDE